MPRRTPRRRRRRLLAGSEPRGQVAHDLGVMGAEERVEVVLLAAEAGLTVRPLRHVLDGLRRRRGRRRRAPAATPTAARTDRSGRPRSRRLRAPAAARRQEPGRRRSWPPAPPSRAPRRRRARAATAAAGSIERRPPVVPRRPPASPIPISTLAMVPHRRRHRDRRPRRSAAYARGCGAPRDAAQTARDPRAVRPIAATRARPGPRRAARGRCDGAVHLHDPLRRELDTREGRTAPAGREPQVRPEPRRRTRRRARPHADRRRAQPDR